MKILEEIEEFDFSLYESYSELMESDEPDGYTDFMPLVRGNTFSVIDPVMIQIELHEAWLEEENLSRFGTGSPEAKCATQATLLPVPFVSPIMVPDDEFDFFESSFKEFGIEVETVGGVIAYSQPPPPLMETFLTDHLSRAVWHCSDSGAVVLVPMRFAKFFGEIFRVCVGSTPDAKKWFKIEPDSFFLNFSVLSGIRRGSGRPAVINKLMSDTLLRDRFLSGEIVEAPYGKFHLPCAYTSKEHVMNHYLTNIDESAKLLDFYEEGQYYMEIGSGTGSLTSALMPERAIFIDPDSLVNKLHSINLDAQGKDYSYYSTIAMVPKEKISQVEFVVIDPPWKLLFQKDVKYLSKLAWHFKKFPKAQIWLKAPTYFYTRSNFSVQIGKMVLHRLRQPIIYYKGTKKGRIK